MRKLLCSLTILATSAALTGAAVAANTNQHFTRRIMLPAGKGANTSGHIQRMPLGKYDNPKLAQYKAQNHLSYAMNQKIKNAALKARKGGFVDGTIDTIPYFQSWFITGNRNSVYPYAMAGQAPAAATTGINNRILPLEIILTDANGNPLYDFNPLAATDAPGNDLLLVEDSPLYDATTTYNGLTGQVLDTAQIAEFGNPANWRTLLNPAQTTNAYVVALDPTAWAYLVDQSNNIVGVAADITVLETGYSGMLCFENTGTFNCSGPNYGTLPNNVVPIILTDFVTAYIPGGGCCVLGFHTAQTGLADPAGILVWTWGTFIPHNADNGFTNPFGLFGYDTFVLSHELSELFNDPFVNTNVSPWVDGSVSFWQGNLETGDTIEAMAAADSVYYVNLNPNAVPYTYNLQNVALLDWFTRNPLNGGIYSWPNINTLSATHVPDTCASGPTWVYGEGSAGFFFCNSNTGW